MTIRIVPAKNGWRWISQGLALYRQYFFLFLAISALLTVVLAAVGSLFFIHFSGILFLLAIFCIVAGILNICHHLVNGKPVLFTAFMQPFKEQWKPLTILSAVYLGVASFFSWRFNLFVTLPPEEAEGPVLFVMLIVMIVFDLFISILTFMFFSLTPFLVAWRKMTVFEAIKTIFIVWVKNWRAFLMNQLIFWSFLLVFFCFMFFPFFFPLNVMFIIPSIIFLLPLCWATLYYCCLDIFPEPPELDGEFPLSVV